MYELPVTESTFKASFTLGTFFSFLSVDMCASVRFFIIFTYHLSMFLKESIQSSIQLLFPFLQADTSLLLITNTLLINNLPPELQPFLLVLCHEMLKERVGGTFYILSSFDPWVEHPHHLPCNGASVNTCQ